MFPVASAALLLSGCWTPPSADVHPAGPPRVVEGGIDVERVAHFARVESVDRASRTVVLSERGVPLTVRIGRGVRNWSLIRAGDRVRARIEEVLTLYVGPENEIGSLEGGARGRPPDARVLLIDPSYRVLTVQYPNGGTEAFKIGLATRTSGIEAGDSVAIRPVQVIELRVLRNSNREESSRPSPSTTPVS